MQFYVYQLIGTIQVEDWGNGGELTETEHIIDSVVLNDCEDNLCIGGYGKDAKYYQFDSYEGYHASSYFEKKYKEHGLRIECKKINIPDDVLMKYVVKE